VSDTRSVVARYALFQVPELLLVGIGLVALTGLGVVTVNVAWLLLGAWILKEVVLFPFVRRAYEPSDPSGSAYLIGVDATVTQRLNPNGRVRIGPGSWAARLPAGSAPAEVGATVCVKSVEGLTLHVDLSES
jgi:membrane protein implicated in regulation of membrane protease activity